MKCSVNQMIRTVAASSKSFLQPCQESHVWNHMCVTSFNLLRATERSVVTRKSFEQSGSKRLRLVPGNTAKGVGCRDRISWQAPQPRLLTTDCTILLPHHMVVAPRQRRSRGAQSPWQALPTHDWPAGVSSGEVWAVVQGPRQISYSDQALGLP